MIVIRLRYASLAYLKQADDLGAGNHGKCLGVGGQVGNDGKEAVVQWGQLSRTVHSCGNGNTHKIVLGNTHRL